MMIISRVVHKTRLNDIFTLNKITNAIIRIANAQRPHRLPERSTRKKLRIELIGFERKFANFTGGKSKRFFSLRVFPSEM